jgi:hypothetical protein
MLPGCIRLQVLEKYFFYRKSQRNIMHHLRDRSRNAFQRLKSSNVPEYRIQPG